MKLTDEQCDNYRRLDASFDNMLRAAFEDGQLSGKSEAYKEMLDYANDKLTVAGLKQCS